MISYNYMSNYVQSTNKIYPLFHALSSDLPQKAALMTFSISLIITFREGDGGQNIQL